MNIAILTSMHSTLENVEVHGKDNMMRLIACMNALEQLIQEASQPVSEPPQAGEASAEKPDETTEGAGS